MSTSDPDVPLDVPLDVFLDVPLDVPLDVSLDVPLDVPLDVRLFCLVKLFYIPIPCIRCAKLNSF